MKRDHLPQRSSIPCGIEIEIETEIEINPKSAAKDCLSGLSHRGYHGHCRNGKGEARRGQRPAGGQDRHDHAVRLEGVYKEPVA